MKQLKTVISKAHLGTVCADAISELERAIRKHPEFPCEMTNYQPDDVATFLGSLRHLNDTGKATASTIFEEEFMEFLMEVQVKRPGHAREELVQAIAMLLRIYCHLDDYCSHRGTESTEVKHG
jgi:hypothetical protein